MIVVCIRKNIVHVHSATTETDVGFAIGEKYVCEVVDTVYRVFSKSGGYRHYNEADFDAYFITIEKMREDKLKELGIY